MTRRLTPEEGELWERLRRSVRPLRPAKRQPETRGASSVVEAETRKLAPIPPAATAPSLPRKATAPKEKPLTALEERTRRRLSRGLIEVESRIDLHGMRQERAFAALIGFLKHAQLRGSRFVLVITGKGREGANGRGVLRESVPAWLSRPEFRDLIVGFEEAGRRHGGAGALYVRVRRRRERAAGG